MASVTNFLSWDLGYSRRWPVLTEQADLPPAGTDSLRRWVFVEDGRRLSMHVEGRQVPLSFSSPGLERDVRRELKEALLPALWRVRLEPDVEKEDYWSGELELITCPLPSTFDKPFTIFFPEAFEAEKTGTTRRLSLGAIREMMSAWLPRGCAVFIKAPLFAFESGGDVISEILLDDGYRLEVQTEGPPGRQYFLARKLLPPAGARREAAVRIVTLPEPPAVEDDLARVRFADLTPLGPIRHTLLNAWLEYEGLENEREQALYQQRNEAPLEFNEMIVAEGRSFDLAIANPSNAERWAADHRIESVSRVPVQIASFGGEKPRAATIERLQRELATNRVIARVSLDDEAGRPPGAGRVLVVENRGAMKARERRKNAIEMLRKGEFGNPRLLNLLMNPGSGRSVSVSVDSFLRSHDGYPLEEKQAEAVAKGAQRPDLLLIQGPPGTGKTQVIAALVQELLRRYGQASRSDAGPFRILVAGAHNEAVNTALKRIGPHVEIHFDSSDEELLQSAAKQIDERGRKIARNARERLARNEQFAALESLEALAQELVLVQKALTVEGLAGARPRFLALKNHRIELLPEHQRQEFQTWTNELERLLPEPTVPECSPDRPVLADQLRTVVDAVPAASTDSMAPLMQAMDELARICERDDAGAGEVDCLVLAEEWLRVRATLLRAQGRPGGVERTWPAIQELQLRGLPPVVQASNVPFNGEARLLERRLHNWCAVAGSYCEGRLSQLRNTEDYALLQWVRELEENPTAYRNIQEQHAPAAAATCQRSDRVKGAEFFDVVIIDEAARAGFDVLIPLTLARHAILVGDHKQLPPHIEDELWTRINVELQESLGGRMPSLFAWLREQLPPGNFVALDKQFRMHEDIGTLVSQAFYEPDVTLKHHFAGTLANERRLELGLFGNEPAVWIDTSDRPDSNTPLKKENEYERRVVTKLLLSLPAEPLDALRRRHKGPPVALLCFYMDQKKHFESWLDSQSPALRDNVELATVHSVQGREFPLVIIATTRSMPNGRVGFLTEATSANVAVSRAQSQVIIVGDSATLASEVPGRGSPPWKRVFELLSAREELAPRRRVVMARELLS